ncbi:MotA/TolQ/ExbB proton channel family protein [Glaciecola petra]|uniref:MotA/TolQ/ExbB proton channel family protein n=1 Tax=Glaciecola petra TaxID=3075602 RepID=A0ABU2ZSV2_9ALTE|nr:MotA/TolQ/ExbB proton channel family protein [Aestuariibacter sp. P117]MDT0595722.1 MotA/TolQ/ExbB proton channel family protein [Aestuariibacter sp. P117]
MKTTKKNKQSSMNPSAIMSLGVFLGIVALVHLLYQGIIRPFADAAIAAYGSGATSNLWVIFKDFEQQASVSIGLFCAFLIIYKYQRIVFHEEPLFTMDYLSAYDKNEALDVNKALQELEQSAYAENSSMSTWIDCLRRYKNTQNVQHASAAINDSVDILAAQLESGNSMIRYFIWAIPSIGFIGTVRGIGSALAKAEEAVSGDISGMVDKLGVAFNSTLVSLVISIILMYLLHVLNNRQDEMVINTQKNCEKHLLTQLHK